MDSRTELRLMEEVDKIIKETMDLQKKITDIMKDKSISIDGNLKLTDVCINLNDITIAGNKAFMKLAGMDE